MLHNGVERYAVKVHGFFHNLDRQNVCAEVNVFPVEPDGSNRSRMKISLNPICGGKFLCIMR